jgi:hypothetical protein
VAVPGSRFSFILIPYACGMSENRDRHPAANALAPSEPAARRSLTRGRFALAPFRCHGSYQGGGKLLVQREKEFDPAALGSESLPPKQHLQNYVAHPRRMFAW